MATVIPNTTSNVQATINNAVKSTRATTTRWPATFRPF